MGSLCKVLDACMKNCGEELHSEVFSKSFMDTMKTVIKVSSICIVSHNYSYFVLGG